MRESEIIFVRGKGLHWQAVVGECLQDDWATWGTTELVSCLDTFVLDLNLRSVFILRDTERASLCRNLLILSYVVTRAN